MTALTLPRRPEIAVPGGDWWSRVRQRWSTRRARREHERECHVFTEHLRYVWRDACEGVGACRLVDTATGMTVRTPKIGGIVLGPPTSFLVELIPGQEPQDLARVGDRLAHSLCFERLRVVPHAGRWVRIELLTEDPLDEQFTLPRVSADSVRKPVLLGVDEHGQELHHAFAGAAHVALQGQNGSGKSQFAYGLLSQLAGADDVRIAGSDITGLLLGRPFDGTVHRLWQVAGTVDIEGHAILLERLVAQMDERLAKLPDRVDKLEPSPSTPLFVVVLEEFPGLLRAAGALPKPARGERAVVDRIKSANLRLLSEGRKVAFRVVTLAQRAEAEALGGGFARDQYALRLSFRVPGDSLEMLHGPAARELGERHVTADPGIAVVSAPGRELARIRVPYLGEYAEYCDRIASTARKEP